MILLSSPDDVGIRIASKVGILNDQIQSIFTTDLAEVFGEVGTLGMSKTQQLMALRLVLVVAAMFAAGCSSQPLPKEITIEGSASADGASLYADNCSQCHGFDQGGDIRDIPPPHNSNGHTWHHPDQQLTEIILEGLNFAVEGQQTMPAFRDVLDENEVRAILDYVKTWWTDEQREFQATVTAQSEQ